MKILTDGAYLYHGSYTMVKEINLKKCAPNKDFGRGFYLTTSLKQAENFVRLSLKRAKIRGVVDSDVNKGYVSVFKLNYSDVLNVKYFEEADIEWLHFVVANRDNEFFEGLVEKYEKYNVIVGKIANDRTAATLQGYMENAYGEVGTKEADERAIATLLHNRLENQICFKMEEAISKLIYIRSDCYEQ